MNNKDIKSLLRNKLSQNPSKSSGFTLLEVLITLVIMGVGILGLASIQLQAMKFVHGAYIQSQVQILAYDMLDRLRANRVEALNTNNYSLALATSPSAPGTNCATAVCTASQMAAFDVYEWREILDEHLPSGKGAISLTDVGSARFYTIEVQWLDNRSVTVTNASTYNQRYESFVFKVEL